MACLAGLAGPAAAQVPPLDFGETVLPEVILTSAAVLQPSHINDDHFTDLLWLEDPYSSRVMLGDGLGGFTLIGGGPVSYFLTATHGDMNGDRLDDLIVGSTRVTSIHLGVGDGTFVHLDHETAGENISEICAADLDKDGDLDVVTVWGDYSSTAGLEVVSNDGTGKILATYEFEPGGIGRMTQVEAADIDGDGVQDLVASADDYEGFGGAVLLFQGSGSTVFEDPIVVHEYPGHFLVARVADLDNDGWVDLVSSAYDGLLSQHVLVSRLNTGGGVFAEAVTVGVGQVRALRDLNGDGIADAVLGQVDDSAPPRVARGVGDGTFLPAEPVTTMPLGTTSTVGRLDQNLSWDLALANSSSKDIHLLLNDQPGWPSETAGPPLAGVAGEPRLWGSGSTLAGQTVVVKLVDAAPTAPVALVIGTQLLSAPLKGGLLGPAPSLVITGLTTNDTGRLTLSATWPSGLPFGFDVYLQAWITDPAAAQGRSASNTLRLTSG